jgi:hypothetical protein
VYDDVAWENGSVPEAPPEPTQGSLIAARVLVRARRKERRVKSCMLIDIEKIEGVRMVLK